jgi:short-subunit dehydrogenase
LRRPGIRALTRSTKRSRTSADTFLGSVALVTGGGSGIGRAIAIRLAAEGAAVVVAGRRPDALAESVELIERLGGTGLSVPTDLNRRADVTNLVSTSMARFGRVDHLVNNAVMNYGGAYDHVSVDQILHMIEVSFTAPLILTRLVLPQMRQRRSGNIVMIGSTAYVGWPEVVTYSSIKAGLDGFVQGLRREVSPDDVHVAAVHPGGTDTPSMTPQARQAFVRLGFKIFAPEVVADAVVEAIVRRRPRVVIGSWEKRHVWRSNVDPRLIDAQLARMRSGFQDAMLDHVTPSESDGGGPSAD